MNTIEFIRHTSKDDLITHESGIEAGLSAEAPESISSYAESRAKELQSRRVTLVASSVDRSLETVLLLKDSFGKYGIDTQFEQNELISSYGFGDDGPINLRDPQMSKLWAEGKETAKKKGVNDSAENFSMEYWCSKGMNERVGNGLTHLEVASRLAKFIVQNLDKKNDHIIAVSHSGDIEFLLYYILIKVDNVDDSKISLRHYLQKTGGALNPLDGIIFDVKGDLFNLDYPLQEDERGNISIPISIIKELSELPESSSVSNDN